MFNIIVSEDIRRQYLPYKTILVLCSLFFLSQTAWASIILPKLFSDGMVLQRGMEVPVWGWSEPGQTISICLLPTEGKAK